MTRREFTQTLLAAGGLSLLQPLAHAARPTGFSFVLLGDLHFDRLAHHELDWLQRDKPDDLRQVRDYSRIAAEFMPRLFATVRDHVVELNRSGNTRVTFAVQVGDLVEGLCGSEALAFRQNNEALEFVRQANVGAPFLFTKGNHDVTGPGAPEAFKQVFHPFLAAQAAQCGGSPLSGARYAVEQQDALFCFFDAYDNESLGWLEATLAKRTARHCFVVLHPPVVPYGARSTWHIFSGQRQRPQRERLLELLGKNNAFVLSGHIHKYNLLVRATAGRGRFLQLGVSSVVPAPVVTPKDVLLGLKQYNADQVRLEPNFSPKTETERRAVYETEALAVKQFEYADLPGYSVVTVNGPRVTAKIYSGSSRDLWRNLNLTKLLES